MAETSKIAWTDATWNIARGCTKVDEDCKYCYMYRESFDSTRYNPLRVTRTKTVFDLPLRIKEPSKIFTSSLTDFFHEDIDSYRNEAWEIIKKCPQHIFQILTKRPERLLYKLPLDFGVWNDNIWLGTSVGSVKGLKRINYLAVINAKIKFVSFEPLHEDLNIKTNEYPFIDWVTIGGESGNEVGKYRYRPCKVEWIEKIIVAFPNAKIFVKQLGTYLAKEMRLTDRHGSNIDDFPVDLQIREYPKHD